LNRTDVWLHVRSAGPNPAHVLRQAEDAVAIRAAQVSKDYQSRDLLRIRRGQTDSGQRTRDERFKIARRESLLARWSLSHRTNSQQSAVNFHSPLSLKFQTFKPFNRFAPFNPPPSSSPASRGRKEVGAGTA
jgi:hypothetical protein